MLANLELRLKEAGINIFRMFAADLSKGSSLSPEEKFTVIITDVPCSGSGTWARTPEQMFGFEQTQISDFATLQQNIVTVSNTSPETRRFVCVHYLLGIQSGK
jgi:16S rRNA (cytosine967-C5)-methyltransferase